MATQEVHEDEQKGDVAAVPAEEEESKSDSAPSEAEAAEEAKNDDDDEQVVGRKRKREKKGEKRLKRRSSESLADVSDFPVDVSGVSFMLMGDVDRSLCEGLIYQHGGRVSKQVLKKAQYVIAGPSKRTYWWGGRTGPDTRIWQSAKEAGKTFISQSDFERWMERVQAAKDEAEREAHAADEHLVQILLEATSLPEVLIDLVVEYAVEEAPILPIFRQWLRLEQRASDGAHSSTLNPPASDEQIAEVEKRLKTRLPFALRQLLRMHNGVSLQGDAAGMQAVPSTTDLLAPRPPLDMFTLPLRWLPWQRNIDTARMPHRIQTIYFVPPNGPLVATTTEAYPYDVPLYVVGQSVEQFMQQYVELWRNNIDNGEVGRQREKGKEEKKEEGKDEMKEEQQKPGEGISAATSASEVESKAEGIAASEAPNASGQPLSPQAFYVAACRPAALAVPCMQRAWPTLREAYPRVWRQCQTTQTRGHGQFKVWRE